MALVQPNKTKVEPTVVFLFEVLFFFDIIYIGEKY